MEGIARIGRFTIDLTEQMGRMMLFVLLLCLAGPVRRSGSIKSSNNSISSAINPPSWSCSPPSLPAWSWRFRVYTLRNSVRKPCWDPPWRAQHHS